MAKKKQDSGEQAILRLALERFRTAWDSDKDERVLAHDDLKFAHNEDNYQWPAEVKLQRLGDDPPRPCLSLNKIPEKIDQVDGEFRQLKPSFKIRGVDSASDPKTAEIRAGIIRYIEWNSSAQTAYNTCHNSSLHCGRGAWRIDIEDSPDDPFVREIVINRITNPLAIVVDPAAKKQDLSDANYQFMVDELGEEEFKAEYPDVELGTWDSGNEEYQGWRTDKTIRRCEYWWKEKGKETFLRVNRPVDGMENIITIRQRDLRPETDEILEAREMTVPRVKWCKMIYNRILEGPFDWPSKYIPYVHETGKELFIDGQSKKRGMVRHAKTPQQMYNYWSSSATEQIALGPKTPYLATAKQIGAYKALWDQANIKNYFYLPYEVDPQAPAIKPSREAPPVLSPALVEELARMEHDIMSAMGIYQSSLGDTGPERSGRAIFARQRQGATGSFTYTDNFGMALVYSMKVILDLIPYVYDTERIIRIIGPDDKETTVPINARPGSPIVQGTNLEKGSTGYINDLSVGRYDVRVTIGPSYSTQREEMATVLGEIIKSAPPAVGAVLLEVFIKTIDMPGAEQIVARIQEAMKASGQPSFEDQLAMKKLELEGLKEMRAGFESKIKAVADLMTAESKERGQQLQEMMAFVEELRRRMGMEGNPGSNQQVNQPEGV